LKSLTKDLTSQDMIRLGLAGGLGTLGYAKSKQAAKQAEQASAEQKALAQPYQTKGQELVRAAEAGELSPTGQQALQATQARLAQGVEQRGGVGAQQAAVQAERIQTTVVTTAIQLWIYRLPRLVTVLLLVLLRLVYRLTNRFSKPLRTSTQASQWLQGACR
jgi:HPt (histidine-containing phosphotransfer) domain-containing protein